jgi:hypothetical protein
MLDDEEKRISSHCSPLRWNNSDAVLAKDVLPKGGLVQINSNAC